MTTSVNRRSRTATEILLHPQDQGRWKLLLSRFRTPTWRRCWMTARNRSSSRLCLTRAKTTWCPRASLAHSLMDLNERVEKQPSAANLLASFNDQSTVDHLVICSAAAPRATCSRTANSWSTASSMGGPSGNSASERWSPHARGRSHPHPGSGPGVQRLQLGGGQLDCGKGGTMPLEGSSPRSAFSAGLDTKTPSTNRAALLSARH